MTPSGRGRILSILLLVALMTSGCDVFDPPTFTEKQLTGIDPTLTYGGILTGYRDLEGQKVLLGGQTVHVDNRTTRAFVQLEPAPLDRYYRPGTPDSTAELFLLIFPNPVDPSALRDGQRITVIGKVRRLRRPALTESGRTVRLVTVDVLYLHNWVPATNIMGGSPFPAMTPGFTGPYQVP